MLKPAIPAKPASQSEDTVSLSFHAHRGLALRRGLTPREANSVAAYNTLRAHGIRHDKAAKLVPTIT